MKFIKLNSAIKDDDDTEKQMTVLINLDDVNHFSEMIEPEKNQTVVICKSVVIFRGLMSKPVWVTQSIDEILEKLASA